MSVRRFLRFGVFAVPAIAALLALGTWQIARLQWKENLIAELNNIRNTAPQNLAANPRPDTPYRKVSLNGRFIPEITAYIGPKRYESGGDSGAESAAVGAWILEPFLVQDPAAPEAVVWITRGWTPFQNSTLAPRAPSPPPETILQIQAVTRPAAYAGYEFLRPAAPQSNSELFTWPDLAEITARHKNKIAARNITAPVRTDIYLVALCDAAAEALCTPVAAGQDAAASRAAAAAPNPIPPLALAAIPNLRNAHRDYAVTWFSLAAALLAVWLFWSFAPPKQDTPSRSRFG